MPDSFTVSLNASSSTGINFTLQTGETITNVLSCGGSGSVVIGGVKYNYSGSINKTAVNLYPTDVPVNNNKQLNITFTKAE